MTKPETKTKPIQLELDFSNKYKVLCKSEYCTFVCFSGSKSECLEYIQQHTSPYLADKELVEE